MAASRQLKLADVSCLWCGGVVIGNHSDKQFCSRDCWSMHRGWLTFLVVLRRGAAEPVLEQQYAALSCRQVRLSEKRLEAA